MRSRACSLLLAVVTAGSLAAFATATTGGASVSRAKPALCAGSTKKAAVRQITTAYDYFLNGAKGYTADQRAAHIEYLSGKKLNQDFLDKFRANAATALAAASRVGVQVDKVTCTGKRLAAVAFTLVLGGTPTPGLTPSGGAVLEGKTWKVTGATVCELQGAADASVLQQEPCATIVAGG